MNSELQVLKKIWENEGKSSIKLISNQTGFGLDYVHYLCNSLTKKGQIKSTGKRGWYKITAKREKEISKRIGGVKKVILPWAGKFLAPKPLKVKSKTKLLPVKEKKLNFGKKIEKVISFLRRV